MVSAQGQETPIAKPFAPTPPSTARKPRQTRAEQPPFNLNVIFLDAAHGGPDDGARLGPNSLEKDATVAFVNRLRTLLTADGFTVLTTRELVAEAPAEPPAATDPGAPPSPAASGPPTFDQRVEMANRSRALACVLVHASSGGHGVHLYTSALTSPTSLGIDGADLPRPIMPWNTAQAPSLPLSQRLASHLASAVNDIRVPLVVGRASVKPIDSMACPTVALELAPLGTGAAQVMASDTAYQGRIVRAVEAGLKLWRGEAAAQLAAAQAVRDAAANAAGRTSAPKPNPPVVKPKVIPEEVPDLLTPDAPIAPKKPAPVIRKKPAPIPPAVSPVSPTPKPPGETR